MALLGGALADRFDRRRLLLLDQIALVAVAAGARRARVRRRPAGVAALRARRPAGRVRRGPERDALGDRAQPRRARRGCARALALNFGLYQLTLVVGPALGGLLIAAGGVEAAYAVDAVELPRDGRRRCVAMARSCRTATARARAPIGRSIAEGLRFVRRNEALMGSFAIDLMAMTFGMPRALFPVLSRQRLRRGRGGHGPAVRGGVGGRDGRGAHDRLARARAPARAGS